MKWQYFPSAGIKATLHEWDMSHYGLVSDLAKMYNGRSRSALRTGPGPSPILLLTIAGTLLGVAMQTTAMSLDRLALERNELPAPAPVQSEQLQQQNNLLVDDMKLASLPTAGGDADMYMLVPESVASQLDAADRNTIESAAESDADAELPGSSDMLMLESDDTPAMQLVELPSDITVAETAAEGEPEALPDTQAEIHSQPEMIEEHVVEHSVEGTVASNQKLGSSQEAQLENAEQAVETATEAAPSAAPLEEEEQVQEEQEEQGVPSNDEPAAGAEDEDEPSTATESAAEIIAEAVEEVEKELEQSADPEAASAPAEEEPEQQQQQQEEENSQPEQQQPQEDPETQPEAEPESEAEPQPQPEQEEKISEPEEAQAEAEPQVVPQVVPQVEPQVESQAVPEEQKPSENEVDTTEASLMDSMVEGIEEGLTAAMDHLVPEEIAEATEDKQTEEQQEQQQEQQQEELKEEQQKESPAESEPEPEEPEAEASEPMAQEVEEEQSPATEAAPINEELSLGAAAAAVQPEELQEAEQEAQQIQIQADEPEEISPQSSDVAVPAEAETEQPPAAVEAAVEQEEQHPEPVAENETQSPIEAEREEDQNDAEGNNQVEPVVAQQEPEMESQPEPVPEAEPETEVQPASLEAEAEKEQKPVEVAVEAEPVAVPVAVVESPQPELTAEPSMLTTIIPTVLPQSPAEPQSEPAKETMAQLPLQVADSVLNYVNASFLLQQQQQQPQADLPRPEEQPEEESPFNAHLRRYDGAQVWRIVVQTDKDKRLADELQSKYDGQLWKEVKQEVDYLLKPQVLAAAERHIRAANLSRIVLIDNLQHVIEVENPPAEKIAELQNRKGHRLTWQAYHRLEDIHGFIDYMAKTYPDICSTEIIGYSVEKRPLKILKISNGNARNPGVWIDGGMHAREWISPATVTFIANQLAEGWEDLPEHMRSINWYIHPVANPDGYEYSHTTDRLWRKNMRAHGRQCPGVDLNRNFGYKWGGKGTSASPCSQTYRGSKAFSEPETFYISKFISGFPRETFQAYLSFHSYGQYILYPWGYDYQLTQDRADLDRVARQAGTSITKSTGVKYTVGSSATTLYPAAGGSDDWAKGIAGIKYAYTIEMGDTGRYGFVLPARFIQYNGKDGYTFADTVARAIAQGRGKAVARNSSSVSGRGSSRRRH